MKRNPSIPGPIQNHEQLWANTQGEDSTQTNSTSTDKNDSVENANSDLTELGSEEAEGFEEDEVPGAEDEDMEEEEDVEDAEEEEDVEEEAEVEEEDNEKEETVSNEYKEYMVIVVAQRRWADCRDDDHCVQTNYYIWLRVISTFVWTLREWTSPFTEGGTQWMDRSLRCGTASVTGLDHSLPWNFYNLFQFISHCQWSNFYCSLF